MRKVIGVGETILDILFKNDQPQIALPGGSVFNGFVSLGRLGVPLVFISELGNDRVGEIIRRFMEDNNIPTGYVDCFHDGKSPISLAFLNENNDAEYIYYKDYPKQRLEVALPKIEEDDIFIFGSYYALNPALRERILELLKYAKERKAIIYYDLNFRSAHAHEVVKLRPAIIENLEYADIIRGSDEDFFNLYGIRDIERVYNEHIKFYCPRFIGTQGAGDVALFSDTLSADFKVPSITPISTIGAGDNFNAGIIYGLLKYGIGHDSLPGTGKELWDKIVRCGIDLSSASCLSNTNYVPRDFADFYGLQS
ncbi:MAG: carbohydrate kinase [Tannerellaceae bacterium]|jgi:fructokinase|nr:carbohydrate kinase [Tannerellaceae bacterium]